MRPFESMDENDTPNAEGEFDLSNFKNHEELDLHPPYNDKNEPGIQMKGKVWHLIEDDGPLKDAFVDVVRIGYNKNTIENLIEQTKMQVSVTGEAEHQ